MKIAIVNEYEISWQEYQAELQQVLKKMQLQIPNPEAKKRAIDQLIDGCLLLCEAKAANLEILSEEIENEFIDLLLEYESKEDFDAMLKQHGLDLDTVKERIKNDLLIKKYIELSFVPVDDIPLDKLNSIYLDNTESFRTLEMVKASHILVKGDCPESLKKISALRSRINSPQDFEAEVDHCSDCPSCYTFGDLGYITRGKMVKEFEDVLFSLKINEISQPVKTKFGYHLIMVTEIHPPHIASFDDVKDALKRRLQQIECELQLIKHIKELRRKAEIYIKRELL